MNVALVCMRTLTPRTFLAGFCAGAFTILMCSSLVSGGDKGGIAGGACPADIAPGGGNGVVDVDDLLAVINAWGMCSQADADNDGWSIEEGDCNDSDPSIHPGAPDLCNGIDDDCNGTIDDGTAPDNGEPNNSCLQSTILGSAGGGSSLPLFVGNFFPAGDHDFLRFLATEEQDNADDLSATLVLTVPAGSSASVRICARFDSCGGQGIQCKDVAPGTSDSLTVTWSDEWGSDDSRHIFVEVWQLAPATGQCAPYQLLITCEG
jgi:hypothetical protein